MPLVFVLPAVRLLRLSRLTRCVAGGGGVSDMKDAGRCARALSQVHGLSICALMCSCGKN